MFSAYFVKPFYELLTAMTDSLTTSLFVNWNHISPLRYQ
ncbi:hypothetical protein EMIT0215P_60243 [Pseudomonas serboccidentalis]